MFGGILDSIPVVGHVKGAMHYFAGDRLAARRSMYEASRSTAVIVGGAAGAIGGPAGIAAGAAAAGAATDAVTSLIVQNPQGIVAGIADIAEDISNGENPLGSIAKTTLIVGTDMIGGAAGPTIGNCFTKAVTESTGKKIVIDITKNGVKQVVATRLAHGATRSAIASTEPPVGYSCQRYRSNSSSSSSSQESTQQSSKQTNQETSQNTNTGNSSDKKSSSSNNSGGQQPGKNNNPGDKKNKKQNNNSGGQQPGKNNNPDDEKNKKQNNNSGGQQPGKNNNPDDEKNKKQNNCNNKPANKPAESHWKKFFNIFGINTEDIEKALEEIIIKGIKIFSKINPWQKKELKDFIIEVNNKHKYFDLSTIIKITEALISELEPSQVTAHNFVNIAKFVLAYLCQELADELELSCKSASDFTKDRDKAAQKILQAENTVTKIVNDFKELMNEIGSLLSVLNPKFVNAIAAVYHYFKHKFIKAKNILFKPAEYINLAKEGLDRMKSLPQFERLQKAGVKRIVYEKYRADVGRRLVIVIKEQNGCWNVSSVYFEDVSRDGDEDGDEWINGEKIPRRCF